MPFARAIIATILATALALIVVIDEVVNASDIKREQGLVIDGTFALLLVAVVILTVPDAISYFRHKQKPESLEEEDK